MTVTAPPLPNLIIGGAQKSGTTGLHRILQSHPQVFIPLPPVPQEIHFFDLEENFAKGLGWYRNLFVQWNREPVVGQTSPLYLYEPMVPQRIASAIPEVKLLFILRNPIDRAYSHYWHELRFGWEDQDFPKALALERQRTLIDSAHRRQFSYAGRGFYAAQLERFTRHFPRSRMKLVISENFRREPRTELSSIASFLGIDPDGFRSELLGERHNPAMIPRSFLLQRLTRPFRTTGKLIPYLVDQVNLKQTSYPDMPPEVRERLEKDYREDWNRLEREWGLDLSLWRVTRS